MKNIGDSRKGKFIVVEGVEGAGKSRQCAMLVDSLNALGVSAVLTREPGGAPLAEKLRALILDPEYSPDAVTELYLYSAARRDHLNKIIFPALDSGNVVVCDRFIYSTLAYQGYGRGLDLDFIRNVNAHTIAPLEVDLAMFIDVSPEEGFARKGGADKSDRLECESLEFFNRVYNGFNEMCNAGELVRIDGSGKKEQTADNILRAVRRIL
ncbi:MAG: dTMP kinase [Clostridiales bacterium]|nr:dTMP kinase [Clostridiales bacterium]